MSQTKRDPDESAPKKTIEKIESPINMMKKSRSILDREIESDEEIAITMNESELTTKVTTSKMMEVFTSLAYCSENQTLCAGTNHGNLYIWKRNTSLKHMQTANGHQNDYESMENLWHLVNIGNVRGAIKFCSWGVCDVSTPCVLVNCISNVYILKVRKRDNETIFKKRIHFFN